MFNQNFQRIEPKRFFSLPYCSALLAVLLFAGTLWTQTISPRDVVLRDRIAAGREKIDTAAKWHATNDQLGATWLQLAYDYQDQLEVQMSEEAYTHALQLLRDTAARKNYAAALHGLGQLYVSTHRVKEAENCQRKALKVFEEIGDEPGMARAGVALSVALLNEFRYAESEVESSKALEKMKQMPDADKGETLAALISRSYAMCFQERCSEGLAEARRAAAQAHSDFANDSLEVFTALLAVGFEQWRTGDAVGGENAMRDALELIRGNKSMPHAMLIDAQLSVLRRYSVFLRSTHQKLRAKEVESEIARLKTDQTSPCANCTVNAVALASVR